MTAGSPLQTGQAAAQEEAIPGAAPGQDRKPDHQPGDHGRRAETVSLGDSVALTPIVGLREAAEKAGP